MKKKLFFFIILENFGELVLRAPWTDSFHPGLFEKFRTSSIWILFFVGECWRGSLSLNQDSSTTRPDLEPTIGHPITTQPRSGVEAGEALFHRGTGNVSHLVPFSSDRGLQSEILGNSELVSERDWPLQIRFWGSSTSELSILIILNERAGNSTQKLCSDFYFEEKYM